MKIRPIGNRVVLKAIDKNKSFNGIIIPDTVSEKPIYFQVLAIGQGVCIEPDQIIPITNMKVGDIVISTYGHDMGDWFIVKQLDADYVYLVDGKNRPIEKPKKKNLKHIVATNKTASDLIERLVGEQKIQNAELRKTLKFFKEQF